MNDTVTIFGDPHGDYAAFHATVRDDLPGTAIFLGDMDLARPFEQEVSDLLEAGSDLRWIVGNHDTDAERWHDNLFGSALADRNLANKVIEAGGLRIAGLGGVFRGAIWDPRQEAIPRFRTRDDLVSNTKRNHLWRGGLPLKHRSTIFPEDFEALSKLRADVLVCHEAPSNHKFGFSVIDELARTMGVKVIIHGHHHRAYEDTLPDGIRVIGVEKAGLYKLAPRMPPQAFTLATAPEEDIRNLMQGMQEIIDEADKAS